MAFVLSLLIALLVSTMLKFEEQNRASYTNVQQEKGTSISKAFTVPSPLKTEDIFRRFYGGGGGGGEHDEGGHDTLFRPGGFNIFPYVVSDDLLHYDLQWQPGEKLILSPKQWHEDEELAFAWHSIMARKNSISPVEIVSRHVCCRILLIYTDI